MVRYLPVLINEQAKKGNERGSFDGYAIFADISGFTALTGSLMKRGKAGAEELSEILNKVYSPLIDYIYSSDGEIANFAGDALTVVFKNECRSGIAHLVNKISSFFQETDGFEVEGQQYKLDIKQGIAAGNIEWGIAGNRKKVYYFKGEAISRAASAEKQAEPGDIVVHKSAFDLFAVDSPDDFTQITPEVVSTGLEAELAIKDNDSDVLKPFLPDRLADGYKPVAEFRDIASVFFSFQPAEGKALNRQIASFIETVTEYDGFISSFEFADKGALFYVIFGAPVSFENNTGRAIDLTLQLCKENNIKAGITHGVAYTGLVGSEARGQYTALGDVVNLAARLVMTAEPGSVLTTDGIYTDMKQQYDFTELGSESLKGIKDKTRLYSIISRKEIETEGYHSGPFVGRHDELSALERALALFKGGEFGFFIYVYGNAGSGKSRLMYEALKEFDDNTEILVLQTDAILRKSLNPFVNWLRDIFKVDQLSDAGRNRALNSFIESFNNNATGSEKQQHYFHELKRLSSFIGALVNIHRADSLYEQIDPQARFDNTLLALGYLIRLKALQKPLIMVIEDATGLDEDSRAFLETLMHTEADVPLVMLAAVRPADDGSYIEFFEDKNNETSQIVISPLSGDESAQLTHSLLGAEGEEKLLNLIQEKAAGNPMYIAELIRYLRERGILKYEDNMVSLSDENIETPDGIKSILIARIDRLDKELRELVQYVSVMGYDFSADALSEVNENPRLEKLLAEGLRQSLWQVDAAGEYHFSQNLLRDAAYEMQLKSTLREKHGSIAAAYEKLYGSDETRYADIAYHFEVAENNEKAREYLEKAAQFAFSTYKAARAHEFYSRLLAYIDDKTERLKIYERLVRVDEISGNWERGLSTITKACALAEEDENLEFEAIYRIAAGEIFQRQGKEKESVEQLQKAIEISEQHRENRAEAYLKLGITFWRGGRFSDAEQNLATAKNLKEELNDTNGRAMSLYYLGVVQRDLADYSAAMKYYEESLELFRETGHKRYITYPLYDIAVLYQYRGDLESSMRTFSEVAQIYQEIGYRSGESAALLNLGVISNYSGYYDESLERLNRSLEIATALGETLAVAYTEFSIGVNYYNQSRFDEAIAYMKPALTKMVQSRARGYYGYVLSFMTCIYARTGRIKMALKAGIMSLQHIKDLGSDVENGRTWLGLGIALSNPSLDRGRYRRHLNTIHRYAGMIATADECFRKAIEESEEADYINTLIPSLYYYSLYLIEKGRKDEGCHLLERARQIASEKGMQGDLKSIEVRLSDC